MCIFLHATTRDDGIYLLVREVHYFLEYIIGHVESPLHTAECSCRAEGWFCTQGQSISIQYIFSFAERHMQRIGRLLQASMFLNYMWQKMRVVGEPSR